MFNKIGFRIGFMSMVLTAVTGILLSLVACQDDLKKESEPLPPDIVLQKLEKSELISKSVCTDKLQAYTVLSNIKNPLKVESEDKALYTNLVFKIYLLADKTYSGSVLSKVYDLNSKTPLREGKILPIKGLWEEKDNHLILIGLGKIRKVKSVPAGTKAEEVKETSVHLVVNSSFNGLLTKLDEKNRSTTLLIEQIDEGPNQQKVELICAPEKL